jgi:hypothetical protein
MDFVEVYLQFVSYTKVSDNFESIWKKFVVTRVASVDIFGAV